MKPLQDIRVLGVTVFLAGPFCAMNLARLGAEVIKVEVPGHGDPVRGNGPFVGPDGVHSSRQSDQDISTRFMKRTQGVKSITLNLKHPEGRDLFLELARSSDVVVENLSPGSMKRLGLSYSEVSEVNHGIVYCSISGYGQTGPYAKKPAHDPEIQGMSGLMDITGESDGPPTKVGFFISDLVTPLFACYSILAALREKDRTGQGQYLDVSMMDTLASLMFTENLEDAIEAGLPMRTGNTSRAGPTGLYHTQDGDISLTVSSDDQWRRLSRALKAPELLEDPRFTSYHSRMTHVEAAQEAVQNIIGNFTRRKIIERLEEGDVPCAPIRTAAEAMADRHFWDRGTLRSMYHSAIEEPVRGVGSGFPVIFSGGPLPELAGAPMLGMHNQEIYSGLLGRSQDDLQRLMGDGAI